jgi:hypothetical protein
MVIKTKKRVIKKSSKTGGTLSKTLKFNTVNKQTEKGGLNCSPIVKKMKKVKGSCYTDDVLIKIKNSYNKKHPENKIKTKNPNKLWTELKQRLDTCPTEDCWLKELNEKEKKEINDIFFAPKQPDEWKNNPTEWLSNYDILDILKQYEETYKNFKFIGPTPIDFDTKVEQNCVWEELCSFNLKNIIDKKYNKIGVIFNLDKHNEPGSHWVSLFVDIEHSIIFYFNSAGETCPQEIKNLVNKITEQGSSLKIHFKNYENYPTEHQYGNTECGMYSLFFIITMLTGETEFKKKLTNDDKIDLFKNHKIPDKYIQQYRNIYFNK